MKKFISTLAALAIAVVVMAQAPEIMNYQAVARNNAGQALANQTIRVRLSVLKNAVSQYSETRQVTTNALGLFNVQIGSTGALSTTGNFAAINWQSNAAPGHVLKVELDINNSGLFTDMGSQALATVPYAFASKTADRATETTNIAGRPIDQTATPAIGSRLSWNGTSWAPVKKDTVINIAESPVQIPAGGGSAPWVFAHAPQVITITGGERIVASIGGGFGHASITNNILVGYSLCFQNTVAGSSITSFFGNVYPDGIVFKADGLMRVHFSSTGAITLPPGQYRIGLAVKNRSTTGIALTTNSEVNGFIEIKY